MKNLSFKYKFHLAAIIFFALFFIFIELLARSFDSNNQVTQSVLHKLMRSMSAYNNEIDITSSIAGLNESQIVVREPYSVNSKGYFRQGQFEISPYQKMALQKIISPSEIQNAKNTFVIGESAGFGFPYKYEQSFSALLNAKLFKQKNKVYNASQPGILTAEAFKFSNRIIESYRTDQLIFFLGNNIWINWQPKEIELRKKTIEILSFLTQSKAVTYLEYFFLNQLNSFKSNNPLETSLYGINNAFQNPYSVEQFIWPDIKKKSLKQFENLLKLQVQKAQQKKMKVILLTVPFNYRLTPVWKHQQPFSIQPENEKAVFNHLTMAYNLMNENKISEARHFSDLALKIEPQIAMPYFIRGLIEEKAQNYLEAEKYFELSIENRMGNLGSHLSINEIIRKVARETQVTLVDVKEIFDNYNHKRNKYFNEDLIDDDCHPTPLGHQLIAEAILQKITH